MSGVRRPRSLAGVLIWAGAEKLQVKSFQSWSILPAVQARTVRDVDGVRAAKSLAAHERLAAVNRCGVSCSVTEAHDQEIRCHEVGYNYCVPKHHCTDRAEWRLLPGKPAEHLAAYYQLDCDYGTASMVSWESGGSEPIYLCESHAKGVGFSGDNSSGVRTITDQSVQSDNQTTRDDRTQTRAVADTGLKDTAPPESARSLANIKAGRAMTDPSVRGAVRDLTYGNSAKALVDETIWNLETGDYEVYRTELLHGKTASEAAQAAGGQLAAVYRKINEYTLKLETVLSESKATIAVEEVIDKPLEHATLEIIANSAMGDTEKDTAIQQLGALQEWIKGGLNPEITPLEAHRTARAVGDRVDWGGNTRVLEELKPAYRALYSGLRNAIRAAVPEAQNLDERLSNLCAAKSDLENLLKAKELNPQVA
jgi:hypothetical protein